MEIKDGGYYNLHLKNHTDDLMDLALCARHLREHLARFPQAETANEITEAPTLDGHGACEECLQAAAERNGLA